MAGRLDGIARAETSRAKKQNRSQCCSSFRTTMGLKLMFHITTSRLKLATMIQNITIGKISKPWKEGVMSMNTLENLIVATNTLPNRFKTDSGEFELLVSVNNRDNSWYALYWQIANGVREHIWCFATGNTEQEAKDNLKLKILTLKQWTLF